MASNNESEARETFYSSATIKQFIKKLLKKSNLKYSDLAKYLDVSETSIKRLMTSGDFSIDRLEKIARWFGMDFFDFMESARKTKPQFFEFSDLQEEALKKDPLTMQALILLSAGFSSNAIQKKMHISKSIFASIIQVLQNIGLLTSTREGKINIKYRGPFLLKKDGDLKLALEPLIQKEVFSLIRSDIEGKYYSVGETYLTKSIYQNMLQEYKELEDKYYFLSRSIQESAPAEDLIAVTQVIFLTQYELWNNVLSNKSTNNLK